MSHETVTPDPSDPATSKTSIVEARCHPTAGFVGSQRSLRPPSAIDKIWNDVHTPQAIPVMGRNFFAGQVGMGRNFCLCATL